MVQTAWALLGLLIADCEDKQALDRGVRFLMSKQVHMYSILIIGRR